VTPDREPTVQIIAQDANGEAHLIEAIVDTGFTGRLTLPPHIITALQLQWREWGAAILADGGQITFSVYDAPIIWDGELVVVPIDEVDAAPLLGMRMMQGYQILIEDVDGGSARIERI
jgi:clan AA aspartic protease